MYGLFEVFDWRDLEYVSDAEGIDSVLDLQRRRLEEVVQESKTLGHLS